MVVPEHVPPMLAVPSALAEAREGFAYEFKWDGVRASVATDGHALVVRSRRGGDVTARYPELGALAAALGRRALLDGEIVAFDGPRPSFSRLQHRMHLTDPARVAAAAGATPVAFLAFDLLIEDDRSLLDASYEDRRARLDGLELRTAVAQVPAAHHGDLTTILTVANQHGLEGVVAKRLGSRYQPGRRSADWRKLRLTTREEFVVGGWRHGEGHRRRTFGSLLLGEHDADGALHYVGTVGSGFRDDDLARIQAVLDRTRRPSSPFVETVPHRDVSFCEPTLVVEVRYAERTPDGVLRQPSFKGLRDDKIPSEVVRPAPVDDG